MRGPRWQGARAEGESLLGRGSGAAGWAGSGWTGAGAGRCGLGWCWAVAGFWVELVGSLGVGLGVWAPFLISNQTPLLEFK